MDFNMHFRQIGFLYKREFEDKPYYSGEMDLGVLGRIRLAVRFNKDKKGQHDPDATLHVQVQQ